MKLTYVLRRPKFPVLCEVPGDLIAAQTRQQLERRLQTVEEQDGGKLRMIDARGEGWGVDLRLGTISPIVESRYWTKAELLERYKASRVGKQQGVTIGEKAALRKRFPELILMIVERLLTGSRNKQMTAAKPGTARNEHAGLPRGVTPKQGQYLAFIYYYTKIHGIAPAETDMQRYFRTSAPSVHQMVKTLESRALIEKSPGQPRSIRLCV